jgi:polyisoprenoid-binding protein YceI
MASAWAASEEFVINDTTGHNTVKFKSDAPLELIAGQTDKVTGDIVFDDSFKFDAKHPFKIVFNVDLASLDTGIALRNEHMRDKFLETSKYPTAVYTVKQIKTTAKPPFKKGQDILMESSGDFTLHGKTVSKTIPLTITYLGKTETSETIRIQGNFPIKLADYGIQRPEMVFQKLAETLYVNINATGVRK